MSKMPAHHEHEQDPSTRGKHLPYPYPVRQCCDPVGIFPHHLTEDVEEENCHSNSNEYQPSKGQRLNHHISPDAFDNYIDTGDTPYSCSYDI